MGWKTTLDITREEAVKIIIDELEIANNDSIAEALEAILGGEDHGWNYTIIERTKDDRIQNG